MSTKPHYGQAVAMLSTGSATSAPDQYRLAAVGGPGESGAAGAVQIIYADPDTGELDGSHSRNHLITATGSYYNLGTALETADIRDPYLDYALGVPHRDAIGQELLVGAAGVETGAGGGAVFWYVPNGQTTGDFMDYGGVITNPSSHANAEFGASIAAPNDGIDQEEPWKRSGTHPDWIAIGAPGIDEVYIYEVDETALNPFTLVQTLTSPTIAGKRFGHSLVIDDFNGDGINDLAVGAPDPVAGSTEGEVHIFEGNSGTSVPLLVANAVTVTRASPFWPFRSYACDSTSTFSDMFGFALASAKRSPTSPAADILIGAPYYGLDQEGAVFTAAVTGNGASWAPIAVQCAINPNVGGGTHVSPEYWGYAIGTGNYGSINGRGASQSPEALLRDIAIGAPGFSNDRGRVDVFFTDEAYGLDTDNVLADIRSYSGFVSGMSFGSAIDSHYVQETVHGDMLIGAPETGTTMEHGTVSLTQALAVALPCGIDGDYIAMDSEQAKGFEREISFNLNSDGDLVMAFQTDFTLTLVDDDGDICESGTYGKTRGPIPEDFAFVLGSTCPTSFPHTFTGVKAGELLAGMLDPSIWNAMTSSQQQDILAIEGDIAIDFMPGISCPDGSAGTCDVVEIDLVLDEEDLQNVFPNAWDDCMNVQGLPFAGIRIREGVCE